MLANDIFKSEHDTEVFLNGFAIGSGNSISVNPNIKPLNVYKNGEYNAPIGVDGYNPILVEVTDPRAQKLDDAVELWRADIDDIWNVRVKILSDVDIRQLIDFNTANGGYISHITYWGLYFCIYMGNSFMFASCRPTFQSKQVTNYFSWDSPPDVVCFTQEIGSFAITSGRTEFRSSQSGFLNVSVNGSFIITQQSYSWDGSHSYPDSEPYIQSMSFNVNSDEFNGSGSNPYIINGDAKFFEDAVNGLYNACRPFFP